MKTTQSGTREGPQQPPGALSASARQGQVDADVRDAFSENIRNQKKKVFFFFLERGVHFVLQDVNVRVQL